MDPAEILKKIRTLEIKTRGLVETAFAGDYHSVFKGRGMNFEDVRDTNQATKFVPLTGMSLREWATRS